MNSDPQESAAWRGFGMLDADETAAFDDAARNDPRLKDASRELDRLAAAVALATSMPVPPRDGHLERIEARLNLPRERRASSVWFGISGWAAAAVLALLLAWNMTRPSTRSETIRSAGSDPSGSGRTGSSQPDRDQPNRVDHLHLATPDPALPDRQNPSDKPNGWIVRQENERLTQELTELRERWQNRPEHERAIYQAVAGVALPVIMKMAPPGTTTDPDPTVAMNDSPLPQLLAEALGVSGQTRQHADPGLDKATSDPSFNIAPTVADGPPVQPVPSAIPIYDAARDAGTLVLSNLPTAPAGKEYNLWVQPNPDGPPVRVGILPDAGKSPSESFDFSLGTSGAVPQGFILTQDPLDQPAQPSAANTVLHGPQAAPK